jgi:hypothetical protein
MSSTLNHPGQEGVGLYRGDGEMSPGPDVIHDDLRPGQPPAPAEGQQGPPISIPYERWQEHTALLDKLGQTLALTTRPDLVVGLAAGNTDSSGNLLLPIYQVAAGMEGSIARLTGNAAVAATGAPYTPAAPYSNAEAYLLFHEVDDPNTIPGQSSLVDFGPPAASGPIFPFLITDNSMQATLIRGPRWLVMRVVSGPLSSLVTVRYQIRLTRMKGVA